MAQLCCIILQREFTATVVKVAVSQSFRICGVDKLGFDLLPVWHPPILLWDVSIPMKTEKKQCNTERSFKWTKNGDRQHQLDRKKIYHDIRCYREYTLLNSMNLLLRNNFPKYTNFIIIYPHAIPDLQYVYFLGWKSTKKFIFLLAPFVEPPKST